MKDIKSLLVKNTAKKDLFLHDLNVKVRVNSVVNIYTSNSILTQEQIDKSLTSGDLFRRLQRSEAIIVQKMPPVGDVALKQTQESKEPLSIQKIKSSVVISSKPLDLGDGESLDFADYGFEESGVVKTQNNAVVVAQQTEKTIIKDSTPSVQEIKKVGNAVVAEGFTEARSLAPESEQETVKAEKAIKFEETSTDSPKPIISEGGMIVMDSQESLTPEPVVKKTRKKKLVEQDS